MIGNGGVVNVVEWIARRIRAAERLVRLGGGDGRV
jgi:hypothetical protein